MTAPDPLLTDVTVRVFGKIVETGDKSLIGWYELLLAVAEHHTASPEITLAAYRAATRWLLNQTGA